MKITEGISGYWHYHISCDKNRAVCGAQVMPTSIKLSDWQISFGEHFPKKPTWCEKCDQIYKQSLEYPFYCSLTNKGSGLFSRYKIKKNSFIGEFHGYKISNIENVHDWREQYMLQISSDKYIAPIMKPSCFEETDLIWFTNHSCEPNSKVVINSITYLESIKDISPGEEITFDYSTTQTDLWSMICDCGSKNCRLKITNIGKLTIPQFWKIKSMTPRYAVKKYLKELI